MSNIPLDEMRRLAIAARKLEELIDRSDVALARFGDQKVLMICGLCEGTFTVDTEGIKCRNCGQLIKIKWPNGITPSASTLRFLLRHGADLFGDDLPDDKAA